MGLNVTEQLAVVPLPARRQDDNEKLPGLLLAKVAVPWGVIGVPGLTSTTLTVHVIGLKKRARDAHDKVVETPRMSTVRVGLAALAIWLPSPR